MSPIKLCRDISVSDVENVLLSWKKLFHLNKIFNLTGYYGIKSIEKWKFETWNEPDLRGYNRLNFTTNGEDENSIENESIDHKYH